MIISKQVEWTAHVTIHGEMRNVYKIFVGKPEGKRPLGRPRYRWEANIIIYLRGTGIEGVDWIHLG
jgi:hypothetical protein